MQMLATRGLTHYFGGLCAVSDFNLDVHAGELAGIIGPNGAGKTTVFNVLTGVYRATGGSIRLNGRELVGLSPNAIVRAGIARTFQNIRLFRELTVFDNLRVAGDARVCYSLPEALGRFGRFRRDENRVALQTGRLLDALELAGCAWEKAGNLPYGLQRRLEIGRALATGARVLLLDEPAAGMNPNEVDGLMAFIRDLKARFGLTIVLIEHQMRLVMGLCEQIWVMNFGATIARGTPGEIRSNARVLEAYLGAGPAPPQFLGNRMETGKERRNR